MFYSNILLSSPFISVAFRTDFVFRYCQHCYLTCFCLISGKVSGGWFLTSPWPQGFNRNTAKSRVRCPTSPQRAVSFRHRKIRMKSQRMETALGYPALDGAEIQQLVNEQVVKESEEMKQRLIENFKPSPDQSYLLLS